MRRARKDRLLTASDSLPRIAVIGTGGTIQSQGATSLDFHNYRASGKPILDTYEFLKLYPELDSIADVNIVSFDTIGSSTMTSSHWLALHEVIHNTILHDSALQGVVIIHGTASMEETAFFLHLTSKVDVPIVLIGAQRPSTALSSDAGINLVNGIRAASSPATRGLGTLVVMNDEIHSARDVSKRSTYRLHAFQSPDVGILGYVDPDRVEIYRHPIRRHAPNCEFDIRGISALPRTDIVFTHVDADRVPIDALVAADTKGIVVAGYAPGSSTPEQWKGLSYAIEQGVAVVQCTRAGSGRVLSSKRRKEQGAIVADNLNPQKARLLLSLGLTITQDYDELQRMFWEY
jgi:L-asparaginase